MDAAIHELTAGYALDALDADELRAFEEHLEDCERCRDELASFWETTGALALAASGPEPPARLRDRILDEVRSERDVVVPLASRRRSWTPFVGAVAAVAAAVALGFGIWGLSLAGELDSTRNALDRERDAAAVLADPSARTISIDGARGRLVVASSGDAALVVDGLGDAPEGKTYQLWVIRGKTPVSAGLFDDADGSTAVPLEERVPRGAVVAVTVERRGGVPAPTRKPILASQPV